MDDQSENELLTIIKDSSEDLVQVMDNAVVLSQIALGDEIAKEKINITETIQSVANNFKSQLDRSDMTLEMNLPENFLIRANTIIAEVFKNYISNAIKYAFHGKNIVIDSTLDQEGLRINVRDSGSTIPEENRLKVFERSFQADEKNPGRGLGLSIVKRIAEAHGVEVGVKPNKPAGNVFYIRFPAQ